MIFLFCWLDVFNDIDFKFLKDFFFVLVLKIGDRIVDMFEVYEL